MSNVPEPAKKHGLMRQPGTRYVLEAPEETGSPHNGSSFVDVYKKIMGEKYPIGMTSRNINEIINCETIIGNMQYNDRFENNILPNIESVMSIDIFDIYNKDGKCNLYNILKNIIIAVILSCDTKYGNNIKCPEIVFLFYSYKEKKEKIAVIYPTNNRKINEEEFNEIKNDFNYILRYFKDTYNFTLNNNLTSDNIVFDDTYYKLGNFENSSITYKKISIGSSNIKYGGRYYSQTHKKKNLKKYNKTRYNKNRKHK